MFREALTVARGGQRADPWAEVRSLVAIASVWSLHASEEDALAMGEEALAIAERSGQPFTTAIAHQGVGASLRRLLRLDEALEHAELAVRGLRELGARWELASALGERGVIHRLAGRPEDAETDLREAVVLCRDLKERSLVSWTIAELARTLVARGDPAAARATLDDPLARSAEAEPGSATALLVAESAVAVAEGDREAGLAKALAADRGGGRRSTAAEPLRGTGLVDGIAVRPCGGGRRRCRRAGSRDLGAQRMASGTPGTRAPSPERLTARGWLHPAGGRGNLSQPERPSFLLAAPVPIGNA